MYHVTLDLSPRQIETLVESLPIRDKIHLVQKLGSETWSARFQDLLHRVDERVKRYGRLSDDAVVRLVKRVRKSRHDQGHH